MSWVKNISPVLISSLFIGGLSFLTDDKYAFQKMERKFIKMT